MRRWVAARPASRLKHNPFISLMIELVKLFLTYSLFNGAITLPFFHILRTGLFQLYVLRTHKTPHEIRQFAKGLHIATAPKVGLGWVVTYDNASEDNIQKALAQTTYPASVTCIVFGGFFLTLALVILFTYLWRAVTANNLNEILILSAWSVFALWRFIKTLSIYRVLRAKDRQLQNTSPA